MKESERASEQASKREREAGVGKQRSSSSLMVCASGRRGGRAHYRESPMWVRGRSILLLLQHKKKNSHFIVCALVWVYKLCGRDMKEKPDLLQGFEEMCVFSRSSSGLVWSGPVWSSRTLLPRIAA